MGRLETFNLPGSVAGSVEVAVGVTQFEVDKGGFGFGLVVVTCVEIGQGDGVEVALGSCVRGGDDSGGSGQSSSEGDELHFEELERGLCLVMVGD